MLGARADSEHGRRTPAASGVRRAAAERRNAHMSLEGRRTNVERRQWWSGGGAELAGMGAARRVDGERERDGG